jgi:hypothetical protein
MHRCQTLVLVLLRELLARVQYLSHFLRELAWVHAVWLCAAAVVLGLLVQAVFGSVRVSFSAKQ